MTAYPEFNPFELSKRFQQLHQLTRTFYKINKSKRDAIDPFAGSHFPGLGIFEEIEKLADDDFLRTPLLKWAHHLIAARLLLPARRGEAALEFEQRYHLPDGPKGQFSLAEIRAHALSSQTKDRIFWWQALEREEGTLSDFRQRIWSRSAEIRERLGITTTEAKRAPITYKPPGSAQESSIDSLEKLALQILTESTAAAATLWKKGWPSFADALSAHPAHEGWPARLAPDSLRMLFGAKELYLSVNLDLETLPARLSPMSFPRAAYGLGRALCRGLAPEHLPFVCTHDPHDLSGREVGELFVLWSTGVHFGQRKLRLSRTRATEQSRIYQISRLATARLHATRLLLANAAFRGPARLRKEYPDIMRQLVKQALPPSSCLARVRVEQDEASRFVAFLSASNWQHRLIQEHDEDWYENPRAQEQLRAQLSNPPVTTRSLSDCKSGWSHILHEVELENDGSTR